MFIEEGVGHSVTAAMRDEIIDLYVDKVQRTNEPPVAEADITRVSGLTAQFEATPSTDPYGDIVRYEWVFGDGERSLGDIATHPGVRAHTAVATHIFSAPGAYNVRLRVTDDNNAKKTAPLFRYRIERAAALLAWLASSLHPRTVREDVDHAARHRFVPAARGFETPFRSGSPYRFG